MTGTTPQNTHLIRQRHTLRWRGGLRIVVVYACGRTIDAPGRVGRISPARLTAREKGRAANLAFGTTDITNVTCVTCRHRATLPNKGRYVEPEPVAPTSSPALHFADWDDDTPIAVTHA